jgi:hypothetical protein
MAECRRKMSMWFSGHGIILPPHSTIACLNPYPPPTVYHPYEMMACTSLEYTLSFPDESYAVTTK